MTNDKDLALRGETGVAKYQDADFSGWGDTTIDPTEDLRIPRITVLNGMSDAVKQKTGFPGEFFNMGTNRVVSKDNLLIVPLGYFAGRVYLKDRALTCRSDDRVHGDPGGEDIHGNPVTLCGDCRFSKWHGRGEPPECHVTYNYPVLYRSRDSEPWRGGFLSFRGTGSDSARQMNGDHEADGQPWFFHEYEATAQYRSNEKGDWYVIQVRRTRETTDEEREFAYVEARKLASRRIDEAIATEHMASSEIPV